MDSMQWIDHRPDLDVGAERAHGLVAVDGPDVGAAPEDTIGQLDGMDGDDDDDALRRAIFAAPAPSPSATPSQLRTACSPPQGMGWLQRVQPERDQGVASKTNLTLIQHLNFGISIN